MYWQRQTAKTAGAADNRIFAADPAYADGETTAQYTGFVLQTLGLPLPGDYGEVPAKIFC